MSIKLQLQNEAFKNKNITNRQHNVYVCLQTSIKKNQNLTEVDFFIKIIADIFGLNKD